MVKRFEVIAAYETLLDRPPENDGVIAQWMGETSDPREMAVQIMRSDEFLQNHPEFPVDKFTDALFNEENYQPVFNFPILSDPKQSRFCIDRAAVITKHLESKCISGLEKIRVLDIGCNFGYFVHYFNRRGFDAVGVEANEKYLFIAEQISKLNYLPTNFNKNIFDLDYVSKMDGGRFDVILLLSVLHHTIANNSIEYAIELLDKTLDKVGYAILELAHGGEEHSFAWKDSLPQSQLGMLHRVPNIKIEYLGEFSAMSGASSRKLYCVSRNSVKVGNIQFNNVEKFLHGGRARIDFIDFYSSDSTWIKRFNAKAGPIAFENFVRERDFYIDQSSKFFPRLLTSSVGEDYYVLAIEKVPGKNLCNSDLAIYSIEEKNEIFENIVAALQCLRKGGYYWNDLRSHNIILDGLEVRLVDFESACAVENEDSLSMLQLLFCELFGMIAPVYDILLDAHEARFFHPPKISDKLLPSEALHYWHLMNKASSFDDFIFSNSPAVVSDK